MIVNPIYEGLQCDSEEVGDDEQGGFNDISITNRI